MDSHPDAGKHGATFLELDDVHAALDEIFLRHQEQLLTGDLARAVELLSEFKRLLLLHMRHEEELLLPRFDGWRMDQADPRGLPAEVYVLEHRKIRERLTAIQDTLRTLVARPEPRTRAMIAFLDQECGFKLLLEHHNRREHDLLYPDLNLALPEEARQLTLTHCRREWEETRRRSVHDKFP